MMTVAIRNELFLGIGPGLRPIRTLSAASGQAESPEPFRAPACARNTRCPCTWARSGSGARAAQPHVRASSRGTIQRESITPHSPVQMRLWPVPRRDQHADQLRHLVGKREPSRVYVHYHRFAWIRNRRLGAGDRQTTAHHSQLRRRRKRTSNTGRPRSLRLARVGGHAHFVDFVEVDLAAFVHRLVG